MPTAVAALPQQQGYVIAGVGARIIAWLIDVTLAGIVPYPRVRCRRLDRDSCVRPSNRRGSAPADRSMIATTIPAHLTTSSAMIVLGVQFLYFVGFWTSRWQAMLRE